MELKADTDATAQSWKAELEKTMEKAKETEALVQQLNDALLAREFQTLDDVIKRCKEAGVQGSDLNEGLTLLEKLRYAATSPRATTHTSAQQLTLLTAHRIRVQRRGGSRGRRSGGARS